MSTAATPTNADLRAEIARIQAAKNRIKNKQNAAPPDRSSVLGSQTPPSVRAGEDALTSRGFSYAKAAAVAAGLIRPEYATVEMGLCEKLGRELHRCGFNHDPRARLTVPLDHTFLMGDGEHGGVIDAKFAYEMKSLTQAGGDKGHDPDVMDWLKKKGWVPDTAKVGGTAQSWIQQNLGGALIPFPEMGPLIPLLRNSAALMAAGAQVIPLPPSGRIGFPRQTAPTTGYWAGEGQDITSSNVNTDQLLLSAKKVGALLTINNELIRYGGPVVEQMFRNDMTVTLGLTLDYAMLQAEGSDNVPAGLIGYPGVTTFTPSTIGANGNTLSPQDIYTFIGQIRANNGKFEGWIIRPELMYAILGKRAGVAAVGDNGGLFLFDILRDFNQSGQQVYKMGGYPMYDTPNVPANRVKSSGTNLTCLYGGQWSDYRIGMFGTIEFAQAEQGTPYFAQDRSQVRAILSCDSGPLHPGVYGTCDQLLPTTVGG